MTIHYMDELLNFHEEPIVFPNPSTNNANGLDVERP